MYKVGDIVTIRSYEHSDRKYGSNEIMERMVGKQFRIQAVYTDKTKYRINDHTWDIFDFHDFKSDHEKTFETTSFDIKNLDV